MGKFFYEFRNKKELSDSQTRNFVKYVHDHQKDIIQIDSFAFDMNSLRSKIMLSHCLDCEKYNGCGNCCQGNPYSMPEKNRRDLSSIAKKIIQIIPENQRKNLVPVLKSDSLYTKSGAVTTKGNPDGNCFFSYKTDNGYSKCAIHAYCLENGLNPVKYKPYTCSLFPLFAIRTLSDKITIFCATRDTASFSPYFYTLMNYMCVNYSNLDRTLIGDDTTQYLKHVHRDNVIESNLKSYYRESYIEQENVLRFFVGDSVYDVLISKIRE